MAALASSLRSSLPQTTGLREAWAGYSTVPPKPTRLLPPKPPARPSPPFPPPPPEWAVVGGALGELSFWVKVPLALVGALFACWLTFCTWYLCGCLPPKRYGRFGAAYESPELSGSRGKHMQYDGSTYGSYGDGYDRSGYEQRRSDHGGYEWRDGYMRLDEESGGAGGRRSPFSPSKREGSPFGRGREDGRFISPPRSRAEMEMALRADEANDEMRAHLTHLATPAQ